jgi:hypothetical protein
LEKTGASNNPKALFIPSYADAKFSIIEGTTTQTIKIK